MSMFKVICLNLLGPPSPMVIHHPLTIHSVNQDTGCRTDYTTLHYTTLHYTTLHYTTLHYTTLPCPRSPWRGGDGEGREDCQGVLRSLRGPGLLSYRYSQVFPAIPATAILTTAIPATAIPTTAIPATAIPATAQTKWKPKGQLKRAKLKLGEDSQKLLVPRDHRQLSDYRDQ